MSRRPDPDSPRSSPSHPVVLKMISGALAGLFEVCLALPLDITKTRLQMQSTRPGDPGHYRGVIHCLINMYRNEGPLALWKGFLPALFIKVPKMSNKFIVFEYYNRLLSRTDVESPAVVQGLAGVCVGVTEAFLFNPFEVVKVTTQTSLVPAARAPSAWAVAREVYREHGFGSRGFYKGLSAGVCSNACFNFVFLGGFYKAHELIHDLDAPLGMFSSKVLVGMLGSSLACVCNIPFDVAKTRIQGRQPKGQVKYRGLVQTLTTVYREEGPRALYKGLGPKVLRIGPCGTVMILLYDYMNEILHPDRSDT